MRSKAPRAPSGSVQSCLGRNIRLQSDEQRHGGPADGGEIPVISKNAAPPAGVTVGKVHFLAGLT